MTAGCLLLEAASSDQADLEVKAEVRAVVGAPAAHLEDWVADGVDADAAVVSAGAVE